MFQTHSYFFAISYEVINISTKAGKNSRFKLKVKNYEKLIKKYCKSIRECLLWLKSLDVNHNGLVRSAWQNLI